LALVENFRDRWRRRGRKKRGKVEREKPKTNGDASGNYLFIEGSNTRCLKTRRVTKLGGG